MEGKVAAITGGASGIGKGFVDILLQQGAKVSWVIIYTNINILQHYNEFFFLFCEVLVVCMLHA